MNEEVHYLLTKGRISRRAFWLRLLFAGILMVITNLVYYLYLKGQYGFWLEKGGGFVRNESFLMFYRIFETFNFIVFPLIIGIFIVIQAIKKIHDTNRSGWWVLFPIYNFVLILKSGTVGNNDFGIDPAPRKKIEYFDELR